MSTHECFVCPFADSAKPSSWSPLYGGGTKLDKDAIQIIHCIYCKDCRMEKQAAEQAKLAAGGGGGEADSTTSPAGPTSPQTSLEEFSLQQSMDKNKECE